MIRIPQKLLVRLLQAIALGVLVVVDRSDHGHNVVVQAFGTQRAFRSPVSRMNAARQRLSMRHTASTTCTPAITRPSLLSSRSSSWSSSILTARLKATSSMTEKEDGNQDNETKADKATATTERAKTIVVIGGGWAGFSAADALARASGGGDNSKTTNIYLLDASPRGVGGLSRGWRTAGQLNRPVEAGIHGFWRDYNNVYDAMIHCIGISNLNDVLTPYTPSILVSERGRVAVAPVLGGGSAGGTDDQETSTAIPENMRQIPFLQDLASQLPPPLDIALLTNFEDPSRLSVIDRLSGLGLLGVWADFDSEDADSWRRYDSISADNLFRNIARLSPALYTELVLPLLHVLPMTTAYDCSAAAALSCFHTFALASRGAFDVRWCRGSIAELIFDPWAQRLVEDFGVHIQGGAKVMNIVRVNNGTNNASKSKNTSNGSAPQYVITLNDDPSQTIPCDAVILAVGARAAARLAATCPVLQPWAESWKPWRGITCVAVRLFFRNSAGTINRMVETAMADSPVVVCGPNLLEKDPKYASILVETGFCIYDLTRMQDLEFGNNADDDNENLRVLEVDFFRADTLADLDDDAVLEVTRRAIAAALSVSLDPLSSLELLDSSVVRARRAVSHFTPGSAAASPGVKLGSNVGDNLYICGDWVDRTGHASWSSEKAVVTGRQAAAQCAQDMQLPAQSSLPAVIPAPVDTPALAALRQTARTWRQVNPLATFPRPPWAR